MPACGLRTFDASDVAADVLVKPVGVDLLLVEVGQVLLEDIIRRPVGLAQVLHELKTRDKNDKSVISTRARNASKWLQKRIYRISRHVG